MRLFTKTLILLFFLCFEGYANIEEILKNIPQKEREKIAFFFTFLVQRDTFGFVLFGETKCTTFTGIPLTHKEYFLPYKIDEGYRFQRHLKESWYAWKRHEWRFKHPNFIICEEYNSVENEMHLQLFLMDKRKLRLTLEKYKEDFIEVLGESFSAEKFIAKLEKKKKLRPVIKYDEKLLGILLGFGREASALFRDNENLADRDPPVEYLGKRPPGCLITPVCFRGYSQSDEVQELLEGYQREIVEIDRIFKEEGFFIKALSKFCEYGRCNFHSSRSHEIAINGI